MCFTVPIAGLSPGGAGPSQTPSIAIRRRRLHAGTSVLIGGGPLRISEKYSRGRWQQRHKDTPRLYHSITREYIDRVSGSTPGAGTPLGPDCRGITRIHRSPSRPSHPYGRQPHSLIFMSTLYKATCCLPASS